MRRSSTWPAPLASSVNLPAPEKTDSTLALDKLDCRAVVELLLLRRRRGREVLARHLQLDPALDLHPPWVPLDALDVELLLLHKASVHWSLDLAPDQGCESSSSASLGHVPTSQCNWQPVDFSV